MDWDIDAAFRELDKLCGGTSRSCTALQLCSMDVESMRQHGVEPKVKHLKDGYGYVWCLPVGPLCLPKEKFIYGHSIRQVYLKARKWALEQKKSQLKAKAS